MDGSECKFSGREWALLISVKVMEKIYLTTRAEWRAWLTKNRGRQDEIWLVFYRKHAGKPTLEYDAAVEEALCFGWIDSIIKKLDHERYVRKMTPRKSNSRWSESNKKRAGNLIEQGLMNESGMAKIKEAQQSGRWNQPDRPDLPFAVPLELRKALAKNRKAKTFFNQLAPTYRKQFIGWICVAKRPATKDRRLRESIALLEQGKKLGLK